MRQTTHWATISLLLIPFGAFPAGAAPLDGAIGDNGPVHIDGSVTTNDAEGATALIIQPLDPRETTPGASSPIFQSEGETNVTVVEVRVPMLGGKPLAPYDPSDPAGHFRVTTHADRFASNDTAIEALSVSPESQWHAWLTGSKPDAQAQVTHVSCFAMPEDYHRARGLEGRQAAAPRYPFSTPSVWATCTAGQVNATNPTAAYMTETTVRLTDADGRDRIIETGERKETNPHLPYPFYDKVTRTIELRPNGGLASLSMEEDSRVTISTPALLAAGRLEFPDGAQGVVYWGAEEFRGTLASISPVGEFLFTTKQSSGLDFQGTTINEPPMAQSLAPAQAAGVSISLWYAAGAVALMGLMTMAWKARFVALGLFSRFTSKQSTLENPTRERIMQVIRNSPGVSMSGICRRLDLRHSTVTHHLKVLLRNNLVSTCHAGAAVGIFPKLPIRSLEEHEELLWLETHRSVQLLRMLRSRWFKQATIAESIGVTQARVNQMLKAFVERGYLRTSREGRRIRYLLTEQAADFLQKHESAQRAGTPLVCPG